MIERSIERYFPSFWKWSEQYVTVEHRRRVFVAIAIAAFVYANFRAFDTERDAKERALAETKKVVLDPAILYQDGFPVASIIEPQTDAIAKTMVFPAITASRNLDTAKEFEFRSWKLFCSSSEATSAMTFGAVRQLTYPNFTCRIEGPR
jgi:hypothetical protein